MMGPEKAQKFQMNNKDGFTERSCVIGVPLYSKDTNFHGSAKK